MRVFFPDQERPSHEGAGALRLVAAARSLEQAVAASDAQQADVGVFLNTYDSAHEWVRAGRPSLVFGTSRERGDLDSEARSFFLSDLPPLALFAPVLEAPSRTLKRLAFVTDGEGEGLSSTIAAAIRDRLELGLFATTSASGQALESWSGCRVRVVSERERDDALRPFDMIASYSRAHIVRALAMLKPAVWLKPDDRDAASDLPSFVYSVRPVELPSLCAVHKPDRMLPDLFNWKRSCEREAGARVGDALAALGL